ncbi:hypothetical protein WME98_50265 [Sorangium sp. So ce296]|uniref:hypothetical protein n=1 Tax=Sorangium sp. So ce296 TaxID=3133296 RepID=UPI003F5F88DC
MNKKIGYGASLLLIAGACGLFFGPSYAEASGSTTAHTGGEGGKGGKGGEGGEGQENECDEICACVDAALAILNDPEIQAGGGNVQNPQDVVRAVRLQLEDCQKLCDAKEGCP